MDEKSLSHTKWKCKYHNILISYFTHSRRYLDLADLGTDYVLNPTSGDWEQRYLLPPHVEPKKENDHDESEQQ